MRGKQRLNFGLGLFTGITPADAGKTVLSLVDITVLQDHPRGCGENNIVRYHSADQLGSPPRMRGKRNHDAPAFVM